MRSIDEEKGFPRYSTDIDCATRSGEPGYLQWVDIDTLHFVGNFPDSASIQGITSKEVRIISHRFWTPHKKLIPISRILQKCPSYDDAGWTQLLEPTKLGPHRQHFYQLDKRDQAWTHIRLDIFPGMSVL